MYDASFKAFEKALQLKPDFDKAYYNRGNIFAQQNNFKNAIDNYKKAAEAFDKDDANSSEYTFRLAQLYDKMGKTKEAIEAFHTIKEKYPNTLRASEVDKYLARLGETK